MILSLDIETFSSVDLIKSGVYPYAASADFQIMLLAYALDDGPVEVVDQANGEALPIFLLQALTDPQIIKTAFNAQFERTCLARHLQQPMPPEQWRCTQAHALTLGLPGYLEGVAKVLGLQEQKMQEGKGLIRYFSIPCKATKANEGRTRNLPDHDREKWESFKEYCRMDVVVEREVRRKFSSFPVMEKEQRLWVLDQKINDRGIKLDKRLVEHAIKCDEAYQKKLMEEARDLTGLDNPNSPAQLKGWLKDQHGVMVESLSKDAVADLLEEVKSPAVKRLLALRQEMSKTSVKKYEAMMRAMRGDGRAGGLLQYYGANRTGRWCLAKGTPVLVKTPEGGLQEKPIQEVDAADLLWDGKEWVTHDGVVYSGEKEVITWDGVTATPAHVVYLSDDESTSLGEAKERGRRLWRGYSRYTKL